MQKRDVIGAAMPIMIAPGNVRAAIGLEWRIAKELARRHGVRVIASGKRNRVLAIDAQDFAQKVAAVAAVPLESDGASDEAHEESAELDDVDAVLARLGRRRRSSAGEKT